MVRVRLARCSEFGQRAGTDPRTGRLGVQRSHGTLNPDAQFVQVTAAAGARVPVERPGRRRRGAGVSRHAVLLLEAPAEDGRAPSRARRSRAWVSPASISPSAPAATSIPRASHRTCRPSSRRIRKEGLTVPMITTEILSDADPVARPTLETAASLGIPFFKPGYYRYAFVDARKERDAAAEKIRTVAALARANRRPLGFHNHSGYIGGNIWDIVDGHRLARSQMGRLLLRRPPRGGRGRRRRLAHRVQSRRAAAADDRAEGFLLGERPRPDGASRTVRWAKAWSTGRPTSRCWPRPTSMDRSRCTSNTRFRATRPRPSKPNTIAAATKDLAFIKARLAEAYV